MDKRITYINPNIKDYTDYTIIIEDENNQRILVKYDSNINKLVKQEIILKKINEEQEKINNETKINEINIKNQKINIIVTIISILLVLFIPSLIINALGINFAIYSPRFDKDITYSTLMTHFFSAIGTPIGTISFICNKMKLKKEKEKKNILEKQRKYLDDTLKKETTKLNELKEKVNLEKNSIKLETKNIDAAEEINKIIDELQSCSQEYYKNPEKTNNKSLVKRI